jgi:predicted RNA-binding protein with PUA-like domain
MATKKTTAATKQTAAAKTVPQTKATAKATTKKTAKATTKKTATAPTPYQRPADGAFWLMKSEPDVYGIVELERDGRTGWEGVRNYLARNFMRDHMRTGDLVLFYHSNAEPSGVAGVAKVASKPLPDPSQFDPKSDYHDADSPPDAPRWMMVEIGFVERFNDVLSLETLKDDPALAGMPLLQKGQRLSVQPVTRAHFAHVLAKAGAHTIIG